MILRTFQRLRFAWTPRSARSRLYHDHAPGLRVLFCGSDEFSVTALEQLHQLHREKPSSIHDIHVVVKRGKPSGRGRKIIRDVKVKSVADGLGLPIQEIETFTGWSPSIPVDLIVAVSFGLKVPPRLLNASTFGGWNLHPSVLPNLRGPAPLQHTLLRGLRSSGVTLQTLHPEHFDQGRIVDSVPFNVPLQGECTFEQLRDHAASVGAALLTKNLEALAKRREFDSVEQYLDESQQLVHAAKITRDDREVKWDGWTAEQVLRTQRALGTVWSHHGIKDEDEENTKREPNRNEQGSIDFPIRQVSVMWHALKSVEDPDKCRQALREGKHRELLVGHPSVIPALAIQHTLPQLPSKNARRVVIATADGQILMPSAVTVSGKGLSTDPAQAMSGIY